MNYVAGSLSHFRQAVRERRKEDDTRTRIETIMKEIEEAVNNRRAYAVVDEALITEDIYEMMEKDGYGFEEGIDVLIVSGWE